jgi:SSS family solute:Na+ symporter
MFHQVQDAKPGFAALKGDQLSPVWFSSTVLLTALGFYMWPHTFGSALTARNEDVFRRNAIFMPLYQLLIAFVLLVGFVAVLRLPGLGESETDLALLGISQRAFPDWFVGLIGSAGMLCALVPGSMLLIASATIVARNVYRGLNPHASDATVTTLTKMLVPVVALGAVAFVFAGGQTIVTLLLLGYALVTQLFPALLWSLVRPGFVTRAGAIAGIVVGVGVVAAMTFSGATPGSSTTLDALVGGLPAWLADLNLGVVALGVNVLVTAAVSRRASGCGRRSGAIFGWGWAGGARVASPAT